MDRAVFAHYMLGSISDAHIRADIVAARQTGLDAFALNIACPLCHWVAAPLRSLFAHAEALGFRLFVSMDLHACGVSPCGHVAGPESRLALYDAVFATYMESPAYFCCNDAEGAKKPLVSTFSSGGLTRDLFLAWKARLGREILFIPDFDDTEGYYDVADGWWAYWRGVVDGLFSWEAAWSGGRMGASPLGSVEKDVALIRKALAEGKSAYMMGLSALQYKNAYGGSWYRPGGTALPQRMANILDMPVSDRPRFVQVISWNDGPESHYIGQLWPEQNQDTDSMGYIGTDFDHTAWQPFVSTFAHAFKNGLRASQVQPPPGLLLAGAIWYESVPHDVLATEPDGASHRAKGVSFSVILSPEAQSGYVCRVESSGQTYTFPLGSGLNWGSTTAALQTGKQKLVITGPNCMTIARVQGKLAVLDRCHDGITNLNPVVVGFCTPL